jgi:hypothetical protein
MLAVPTRHAAWSANLLLLAVLAGEDVKGSELFPGAEDVKSEWHRMALLWRSQLQQGWTALIHTLDLAREWRAQRRELRLSLAANTANPAIDPYWTYDYAPASEHRGTTAPEGRPASGWAWQLRDNEGVRRQSHFVCGHDEDVVAHALEPLAADLGSAIVTFGGYWPNRCVSAAHALIRLWMTAGQDAEPSDLQKAYDTCLQIALYGFAPHNEAKERYA